MNQLIFPYADRFHPVFGTITRPILTLHLYSERFGEWVTLRDVLVDAGADVSVLAGRLGNLLVADVQAGEPIYLGQSASEKALFNAFLHRVQAQIGQTRFEMPVAIAMSLVPPIFGRREALDRFTAHFIKGREVVIEIDEDCQ